MSHPILTGPIRPPASGNAPKQLVILLHGWGADGANLIDLADGFAAMLPDAQFIAPNAPQLCEANPYGFQWFSFNNRAPAALLAGVSHAAEGLNAFIDAQAAALGLREENIALVGFSQGTMLALQAALARAKPVACVVGFSGMLIGAEAKADVQSRPPVCLIHGQADEVVPYSALAAAEAGLKARGVSVETHTRPRLGHSIDLPGIEIAAGFLGKYLKR